MGGRRGSKEGKRVPLVDVCVLLLESQGQRIRGLIRASAGNGYALGTAKLLPYLVSQGRRATPALSVTDEVGQGAKTLRNLSRRRNESLMHRGPMICVGLRPLKWVSEGK